jgi:hypothetical protein
MSRRKGVIIAHSGNVALYYYGKGRDFIDNDKPDDS